MAYRKTRRKIKRLAASAKDTIINAVDRILQVKERVYTGAHEVRQSADDSLERHDAGKKIRRVRR